MKLRPLEPPRRFTVGARGQITISDCGKLDLEPDEQVTFTTPRGAEYDVARKDWGFYATPSTNGRLPSFGLRAALAKNAHGRFYVFLVERGSEPAFEAYLREEDNRVVLWLDDPAELEKLERSLERS